MKRWVGLLLGLFLLVAFPFTNAKAEGSHWVIVISTKEKETAWNALRVADFALKQGAKVSVFLLGEGVKASVIEDETFNVKKALEHFVKEGGKVYACRACLKIHHLKPTETCPVGTRKILYDLISQADRILTF
ncbi:DsrE family protein [Thermosulfurimonas dismutans]|uniref:Uncharacterized protein n=1 Tax=Thermosulfurimonas dismutans TaxID=999894 RepID=A0A179D6G6_9BACT|nr:DsrE family protein [Thermosulfurimonas dismutans]OAQ21626.1 hypothetical protein TDIS_0144 [Thermosulfurimonas dismutans]